ncbi:hypothetical protein [Streptomyces sp. ISL-98]|uniref:hypothetical protein n=1 Tax=Streptomyces sp. ISL-98 TaxID=2819192 RepID=UPI0035AE999D
MHEELLVLGVKVAASTVWEIVRDAGIDPAPKRAATKLDPALLAQLTTTAGEWATAQRTS